MSSVTPASTSGVVSHHLRLFGVDVGAFTDVRTARLIVEEDGVLSPAALDQAAAGALVVVCSPAVEALARVGVRAVRMPPPAQQPLVDAADARRFFALRTLHCFDTFHGETLLPIVVTEDGRMAWAWLPHGVGGLLLVGTRIAEDLIRFRQGDLQETLRRPQAALWGIEGERPNYLFESQIAGLPRHARPADEWCELLARFVARQLGGVRRPMLPGGAAGAIVLTGDDDQAQLEKYAEQGRLLGSTPMTYFLHPLTRHNATTIAALRRRGVDFGIHPDALERPADYAYLLDEQCAWYRDLMGEAPVSVRNHGFLNDGYWGHVRPWLCQGIRFSSNLPGLDGRVLNGSLLPARLSLESGLTDHWSVLTAIGDGVRYVDGGRSDAESANCIFDLADAIRHSAIPGVMVLNLHPQNVADTRAMHLAALEVIRSGFVAWNMRDCLDWFAHARTRPPVGLLRRTLGRLLPERFDIGPRFFGASASVRRPPT